MQNALKLFVFFLFFAAITVMAQNQPPFSKEEQALIQLLDNELAKDIKLQLSVPAQGNVPYGAINADTPNFWGMRKIGGDLLPQWLAEQKQLSSTKLGILDAKFDVKHPALAGIVTAINLAEDHGDGFDEMIAHGTHVAGTAIGNGPFGLGTNAPVEAFVRGYLKDDQTEDSQTEEEYKHNIIERIIAFSEKGVKGISASLEFTGSVQLVAIDKILKEKGILFVNANGNDRNDLAKEAALQTMKADSNLLMVSAIASDGVISDFSNYGKVNFISAPGSDIFSLFPSGHVSSLVLYQLREQLTIIEHKLPSGEDVYLVKFDGTSMAAPHVIGVIGLMNSVNPKLTDKDVMAILKATSIDLGQPGHDPYYGHGCLNAYAAVLMANGMKTLSFDRAFAEMQQRSLELFNDAAVNLQAAVKTKDKTKFLSAIQLLRRAYFLDANNIQRKKLLFIATARFGFKSEARALAVELYMATGNEAFLSQVELDPSVVVIAKQQMGQKVISTFANSLAMTLRLARSDNEENNDDETIAKMVDKEADLKLLMETCVAEKNKMGMAFLSKVVKVYFSKHHAEKKWDAKLLQPFVKQMLSKEINLAEAQIIHELAKIVKTQAQVSAMELKGLCTHNESEVVKLGQEVFRLTNPTIYSDSKFMLYEDYMYAEVFKNLVEVLEKKKAFDQKICLKLLYLNKASSHSALLFGVHYRKILKIWQQQSKATKSALLKEANFAGMLLSQMGLPEAEDAIKHWLSKTGIERQMAFELIVELSNGPQIKALQTNELNNWLNDQTAESQTLENVIHIMLSKTNSGELSQDDFADFVLVLAKAIDEKFKQSKQESFAQFVEDFNISEALQAFSGYEDEGTEGFFFKLNERVLERLIKAYVAKHYLGEFHQASVIRAAVQIGFEQLYSVAIADTEPQNIKRVNKFLSESKLAMDLQVILHTALVNLEINRSYHKRMTKLLSNKDFRQVYFTNLPRLVELAGSITIIDTSSYQSLAKTKERVVQMLLPALFNQPAMTLEALDKMQFNTSRMIKLYAAAHKLDPSGENVFVEYQAVAWLINHYYRETSASQRLAIIKGLERCHKPVARTFRESNLPGLIAELTDFEEKVDAAVLLMRMDHKFRAQAINAAIASYDSAESKTQVDYVFNQLKMIGDEDLLKQLKSLANKYNWEQYKTLSHSALVRELEVLIAKKKAQTKEK